MIPAEPPNAHEAAVIAAYQARLRELKPRWERNFLFIFLPGFLMFAIGGPGGLLLPGGQAHHNLWLIIPGVALCLIGGIRGFRLMSKYRRCPQCETFQQNEFRIPYRTCVGCGARLSSNWKEKG